MNEIIKIIFIVLVVGVNYAAASSAEKRARIAANKELINKAVNWICELKRSEKFKKFNQIYTVKQRQACNDRGTEYITSFEPPCRKEAFEAYKLNFISRLCKKGDVPTKEFTRSMQAHCYFNAYHMVFPLTKEQVDKNKNFKDLELCLSYNECLNNFRVAIGDPCLAENKSTSDIALLGTHSYASCFDKAIDSKIGESYQALKGLKRTLENLKKRNQVDDDKICGDSDRDINEEERKVRFSAIPEDFNKYESMGVSDRNLPETPREIKTQSGSAQ